MLPFPDPDRLISKEASVRNLPSAEGDDTVTGDLPREICLLVETR